MEIKTRRTRTRAPTRDGFRFVLARFFSRPHAQTPTHTSRPNHTTVIRSPVADRESIIGLLSTRHTYHNTMRSSSFHYCSHAPQPGCEFRNRANHGRMAQSHWQMRPRLGHLSVLLSPSVAQTPNMTEAQSPSQGAGRNPSEESHRLPQMEVLACAFPTPALRPPRTVFPRRTHASVSDGTRRHGGCESGHCGEKRVSE